MYSSAIRERFMNPLFAGVLLGDSVLYAKVGAPEQGAVLELYLALDSTAQRIAEARFKVYGCGACIAVADYTCEHLVGLNIEQIHQFDTQQIAQALALSSVKLHCVWLVSEALEQLLLAWHQAEASLTH